MNTKRAAVIVFCSVGWGLFGYHVYQGYGLEHTVGFVGFLMAAIGHAISAGVIYISVSGEPDGDVVTECHQGADGPRYVTSIDGIRVTGDAPPNTNDVAAMRAVIGAARDHLAKTK